jgi:hypothetical protein
VGLFGNCGWPGRPGLARHGGGVPARAQHHPRGRPHRRELPAASTALADGRRTAVRGQHALRPGESRWWHRQYVDDIAPAWLRQRFRRILCWPSSPAPIYRSEEHIIDSASSGAFRQPDRKPFRASSARAPCITTGSRFGRRIETAIQRPEAGSTPSAQVRSRSGYRNVRSKFVAWMWERRRVGCGQCLRGPPAGRLQGLPGRHGGRRKAMLVRPAPGR